MFFGRNENTWRYCYLNFAVQFAYHIRSEYKKFSEDKDGIKIVVRPRTVADAESRTAISKSRFRKERAVSCSWNWMHFEEKISVECPIRDNILSGGETSMEPRACHYVFPVFPPVSMAVLLYSYSRVRQIKKTWNVIKTRNDIFPDGGIATRRRSKRMFAYLDVANSKELNTKHRSSRSPH